VFYSFFMNITIFVDHEKIKRELNKRLTCECRCDERLKDKDERSTHLGYTGLCGGLEHLKIQSNPQIYSLSENFANLGFELRGERHVVVVEEYNRLLSATSLSTI
jgi:hypothetical protein